jgi:hypothetical protein
MKALAPSVAIVLVAALSLPAMAQLVPPAPPRTPPSPEYTPPAPPPPPPPPTAPNPDAKPPAPGEPEKPLPSLVQKDEQGMIRPLKLPIEEGALRALDMDDAARAQLETALAARHTEIDRLVFENITLLMEIRATMAKVTDTTGIEDMTNTTKKARTFQPGSLLDSLSRAGAISPPQKSSASRIAKEYRMAIRSEVTDKVGRNNMTAMLAAAFKMQVDDFTAEAWQSLDRQLEAAAPFQEKLLKMLHLPAAQSTEVTKRLAGLKSPPAGTTAQVHAVEVLRGIFFDVLNDDTRVRLLLAANPSLADKPPADKPAPAPAPAPPK